MGLRNILFFVSGICLLFLAKAKNILKGYPSPKPFDMSTIEQCIDYDIHVVHHWLSRLEEYSGKSHFIGNNIVLERGPDSDLGVGIYLLAKGCSQTPII